MNDARPVFAERCRTVQHLLREAHRWPLIPSPSAEVWTAGVGCSEGPARAYALALRLTGRTAGFVPLTQILQAESTRRELVLFSQGLSPNARLALSRCALFSRCTLVTSTSTVSDLPMVQHPPDKEEGLLGRHIGPAVATYVALASCYGAVPVADVVHRVRVPTLERAAFLAPVAFITCGERLQMAQGLRWKWMETLGTSDPPIYDVLSFIHGPFQRWYREPLTLFALRTGEDPQVLWDSLARVVQPQQKLVVLDARLPGLFSFFEHDAAVNLLLEQALTLGLGYRRVWPGYKEDGPIYDLETL